MFIKKLTLCLISMLIFVYLTAIKEVPCANAETPQGDPNSNTDDSTEDTNSEIHPQAEQDQPAQEESKKPVPLSLTISGGVSLGAYQAGYLFYLSEVIKQNREIIDLKLLTGASAGMINSLLTILALDDEPGGHPSDSLLYKVWTELRHNDLLDVEQAPPLALSSRYALEKIIKTIEERWKQGLSEDVDIVLGATATRLKARPLKISDGFSIPKLEENFVFRIAGNGANRPPRVTNYVDELRSPNQPLLPFNNDNDAKSWESFSIIRQILLASSAIPIVFLPQEIKYCTSSCPTHSSEEFVDGSLADKRPLRLAYKIARSGLVKDEKGKTNWQETPDHSSSSLNNDMFFLYIDPDRLSYPNLLSNDENSTENVQPLRKRRLRRKRRKQEEPPEEYLFSSFGVFMRGYLSSAQAKELATLVDEHPEVRDHVELASHDYPTVSGLLLKFFGFFDREFRKFDFYLGMHDARSFVNKIGNNRIRNIAKPDVEIRYPEPEMTYTKSKAGPVDDSWQPFFCLRGVLDGKDEYKHACDNVSLYDFRVLLQVSLDRLYNHCRSLPLDNEVNHKHCNAAMHGERPVRVTGLSGNVGNAWKRKTDEKEFEYVMRLLKTYKFFFRDLGISRDEASLGMSRIREQLLIYVNTFAKKLPAGERQTILILGKPAINFFMYAPPETIIYIIAGKGAELAASATLGRSRWLRFNFALEVQGLDKFLTQRPDYVAFTPAIGLETDILPLSNPLVQTRWGLRAGYQFATKDNFLTSKCNYREFQSDTLICSAPKLQSFLALSFYERIRLQIGLEWLPAFLPPMDEFNKNLWNATIEMGWQWISPF